MFYIWFILSNCEYCNYIVHAYIQWHIQGFFYGGCYADNKDFYVLIMNNFQIQPKFNAFYGNSLQ